MMLQEQAPKTPRRTIAVVVLTMIGLALAIAGVLWAVHPGRVQTNDAQIDGHIHPINTRIAGTINWVNPAVEDTRFVKAGTPLARLDPNDYQPAVSRLEGDLEAIEAQQKGAALNLTITRVAAATRLTSAEAAVADANAELNASISQNAAAKASMRQAMANYRRAEDDRVRYEALVSTHEISRSEYDQRATDAKTSEAILLASQANVESSEEKIESARQKISERESELRSARTAPETIATAQTNVQHASGDRKKSEASLLNARLDLGYTSLVAPVDGIVGRRSMEVGQRVSAGQMMLTLVPLDDLWVTANFRETQLKDMRVGQRATIHVDSVDMDYAGTVESVGGATGSKYAALPPDNATGNYVKVVQRIPVRIRLDNAETISRLRPGMSIEVSVSVK